jgi:chemotaxis protein CheC
MINIGVGRGAGVLNTLLQSHIVLEVPAIQLVTPSELGSRLPAGPNRFCMVMMPFVGQLEGQAALVFTCSGAARLVQAVTGQPAGPESIDTLEAGTVREVGNIVLNGVMGTVGNILGISLTYQVPGFRQGDTSLIQPPGKAGPYTAILANTRLRVEQLELEGDLVLLFAESSFTTMLQKIDDIILEEV